MVRSVILSYFCYHYFGGSSVAVAKDRKTPSRGPCPRSTVEKGEGGKEAEL